MPNYFNFAQTFICSEELVKFDGSGTGAGGAKVIPGTVHSGKVFLYVKYSFILLSLSQKIACNKLFYAVVLEL